MANKKFISFLGGSNYQYCDYWKDGKSYGDVRFIQEATINYLIEKENWCNKDEVIILLTKDANSLNWVNGGHKNKETKEILCDKRTGLPYEGLHTRLEKYDLTIAPVPEIPNGNDEFEIMKIFKTIFDLLDEGDELYFDITHGFRYLPMLIIVLGNYAKFLKNVKIKSITYGNFEVSKQIGHGIIVDLLPLSILQDWTYAAGQYLDSGNAKPLIKLSEDNYKPILRDSKGNDVTAQNLRYFTTNLNNVIDDFKFCRGLSIINSDNIAPLKEAIKQLGENTIEPLIPILKKISDSFLNFDAEKDIKNAYYASKWCFDNGLYQQAATILQEAVVTLVCQRNNIPIDNKEDQREIVNKAFKLSVKGKKEEEGNNWEKIEESEKPILRILLHDNIIDNNEFAKTFDELTGVRNDYNHSGMRTNPSECKKLKKNIESIINRCEVLFENYVSNKEKLFINFSNHPSCDWSEIQKMHAMEQFGTIKDMEFPIISPNATDSEIINLAEKKLEEIKEMSFNYQTTIHIMGEMTLTYHLVNLLKQNGFTCVASTTERKVNYLEDGTKNVTFNFVRFREY